MKNEMMKKTRERSRQRQYINKTIDYLLSFPVHSFDSQNLSHNSLETVTKLISDSSCRKTQVAGELHARDLAEAEGGGGGHTEQHFNQVQSRGALPGSHSSLRGTEREREEALADHPVSHLAVCPCRLWRTCAHIRSLPSSTSS